MTMAINYHIQIMCQNHQHRQLVRVGHSVLKDGFLRYVLMYLKHENVVDGFHVADRIRIRTPTKTKRKPTD